jgi:CubicO group peptidase (beta-lactamase class C family)
VPHPTTADLAAAVDRVLATAARDDYFSGAVCLAGNGEVLLEAGYGIASRRWQTPVTTATRFDTASITKLFTAVAALQQVDAGRFTLDTPITEVVDLVGTTIGSTVTVRHLLTHTSGIADDADEEAGESYEELWYSRPSYMVTQTRDFLPQFAYKPPRVAPGTDCRYCNVGYVLLGLAVEAVTGRAYRDYVREHIFAPAGMATAGFFDMREAVADVAEGWDPVTDNTGTVIGWRSNIYSYPPIGSPDGGAHARPADLVTFLDAVRNGQLLSADLTTAFLTPQVLHDATAERELHYCFGLEAVVVDGTVRYLAKDGINAGTSGLLLYVPATGVTVALLANSMGGVRRVAANLRGLLLGYHALASNRQPWP